MKIITTIALIVISITAFSQPCIVLSVDPSSAHKNYSPDSSKYIVNLQDTSGVFQIYIGNTGDTTLTCISNYYATGNCCGLFRHWEKRNKLMTRWHPSGDYLICGVEKEFYNEVLYTPYNLLLGWLNSGLWLDLWAVKPDGSQWYNLYSTEKGMVGPEFTINGNKFAFAEAQDSSNLSTNIFGVWKIKYGDFRITSGTPSMANITDITPVGSRWNEPGNFSPVNDSLLLITSDIGITNAEGQDQYILNVINGNIVNLNNTPMVWDEHGVFSPDGQKIFFMSSYPYQTDTNSYHITSIKTEFMLMDIDGNNLQQLTHFCDTNYYPTHVGIAATGYWSYDGSKIYAQTLVFPDYNNWLINFSGNCGNSTITTITEMAVENENIFIYPNPASETLSFIVPDELGKQQIQVYNLIGALVKVIPIGNNKQVDISDLPNGLYVIRIENYNGLNKIFIKQ